MTLDRRWTIGRAVEDNLQRQHESFLSSCSIPVALDSPLEHQLSKEQSRITKYRIYKECSCLLESREYRRWFHIVEDRWSSTTFDVAE